MPRFSRATASQLRILGIPSTGARSRVETQINLCLELVNTASSEHVRQWEYLSLPPNMATKKQGKQKVCGCVCLRACMRCVWAF